MFLRKIALFPQVAPAVFASVLLTCVVACNTLMAPDMPSLIAERSEARALRLRALKKASASSRGLLTLRPVARRFCVRLMRVCVLWSESRLARVAELRLISEGTLGPLL